MPPNDEWLVPKALADDCSVSVRTVWNWVDKGRIPETLLRPPNRIPKRPGRRRRLEIHRDAIRELTQ